MRKQEKTVIIVAVGDILSIIIKFVLASITGSMSIMADAWHSMGDLATSLSILVSLFLDKREKKQLEENDVQSGKRALIRRAGWEIRMSIIIGFVLLGVGIGVFLRSYSGKAIGDINNKGIAAVVICILILISYLRFKFESSVGKETNSPALVADAYHSRVDMYVLSLVLISLGGKVVQLPLDKWVAVFIGVLILGIAVKILYRSAHLLFHTSQATSPEKRSLEDNLVLIFLGSLTTQRDVIVDFFVQRFSLDDKAVRKKWGQVLTGTVIIASIIGYASMGFYRVGVREVAILEKLGVPVNRDNPVGPGLHYFYPPPIGKIRRVDVKTIRRKELGYRMSEKRELILWTNVHYIQEYAILTGDNTFLDVAANMHYQVTNPGDFLYNGSKPEDSLETFFYRALREATGKEDIFHVLTIKRRDLEMEIMRKTQELIDEMKLGITVHHVFFRDIHPPMDVAPAFEDVVSAQEDKETLIEQAKGYKREIIPDAMGEMATTLAIATGEKNRAKLTATGRVSAFKAMSDAFRKYKAVNMFRLRMEALESALADKKIIFVDKRRGQQPVDIFFTPGSKLDKATNVIVQGGED